jgi:hypothetical protein
MCRLGRDLLYKDRHLKRREFLCHSAQAALAAGLGRLGSSHSLADSTAQQGSARRPSEVKMNSPLSGTTALTSEGDLAAQMVEGIRRFLLAETQRHSGDTRRHRSGRFSPSAIRCGSGALSGHGQRLMNCIGGLIGGGAAPVTIGLLAKYLTLGKSNAASASVYVLAGVLLMFTATNLLRADLQRLGTNSASPDAML